MIRLAIWYSSDLGRNDGNPLYVCGFLKRAQFYIDQLLGLSLNQSLLNYFPYRKKDDLEAKAFAVWFLETFETGFRIDHLRPHKYEGEYGQHDLNIWVDWGEDGLTGLLGYEPEWPSGNTVYWASDTHLGYDYRLDTAKKSALTFCAQKKAVDSFKQEGVDAIWLPHCVDPQAYPKYTLASKKHDLCFVGHVNSENRIDALDRMFREFPNFYYGQKLFENCARKYAESKIVFNIAMKDDLNMRVFEALGSGSFLLTDNVSSLTDLFEDGKHLALYSNLDEAVEKANHYLANDDAREAIAEAGYKEVLANHTIGNRVKQMFQAIHDKGLIKIKEIVC